MMVPAPGGRGSFNIPHEFLTRDATDPVFQSSIMTAEQHKPEQPLDESAAAPPTTGEESAAGPPSLESQLATLQTERDELNGQLLRALAELENFRKRTNREREEERRYAALPLIRDVLPAIDNLKRGLDAGRESESGGNAVLQGVQMVLKQFEEILGRHGVQPIPALGEPFDPNFHEALQQVPTADYPPLTVIRELEQGYKLHDRVIRPSKVIVSSAPSVPAESSAN